MFNKKEYWIHLRFTDKSTFSDFLFDFNDKYNFSKHNAEGIMVNVKSKKK